MITEVWLEVQRFKTRRAKRVEERSKNGSRRDPNVKPVHNTCLNCLARSTDSLTYPPKGLTF